MEEALAAAEWSCSVGENVEIIKSYKVQNLKKTYKNLKYKINGGGCGNFRMQLFSR